MKRLIIWLFAVFCIANMQAQDFKAYRGTVPGSYNFWFHDPEAGTKHDPNAHFPLLIFLHGKSLSGSNLEKVKRYGPINAVAKGLSIDCYIIAPQTRNGWAPEKVMKIVDWTIKNYAVDTTRIYVYGMSMGGYGTIDLCATYPDRIAAGMAACGGATVRDVSGLSKVPMWILHGTADRAVPFSASQKVVDAMAKTGKDRLIFTPLKGVDHGRPARLFYMIQTYDWLFSHSTKDPGREVCRDFNVTPEMLKDAYDDLRDLRNFKAEEEEYME
jgi:predicted peptidase